MFKTSLLSLLLVSSIQALDIKSKPIIFDKQRIELTKEYIQQHYNLDVKNIEITPRIIVIHHTGLNTLEASFKKLKQPTLSIDRTYIAKSGALNVSAHFMVDTDGTIYQLMPDNHMARHVIGLNYSSIGIENVGAQDYEDNLTQAQLNANVELVLYLKKKYPSIEYLIGHFEYQNFVGHTLWLEVDDNYRTIKHDPSIRFMNALKKQLGM